MKSRGRERLDPGAPPSLTGQFIHPICYLSLPASVANSYVLWPKNISLAYLLQNFANFFFSSVRWLFLSEDLIYCLPCKNLAKFSGLKAGNLALPFIWNQSLAGPKFQKKYPSNKLPLSSFPSSSSSPWPFLSPKLLCLVTQKIIFYVKSGWLFLITTCIPWNTCFP